ncbi:DEAD/DEAH box helicase family protein [Azospirillum canadense]|uniref:DEAD/DEAH box helicase family protein n=1 Tax=Azospirillum canadense TaxID=403962 RepID=UPI002227F6C4|nr:DEAD/DEAH box helicase family protein [Azospirillum canadense]MCW2240712.1 N12 class adenine-specific DNA methylase/GNAT superfamily N-acetyltransferase [Azospirillum canadense]
MAAQTMPPADRRLFDDALAEVARLVNRTTGNRARVLAANQLFDETGSYRPGAYGGTLGQDIIAVSLYDATGTPRPTRDLLKDTRHEVIHFLRDHGLIDPAAWTAFAANAAHWRRRYGIDALYQDANLTDAQLDEEATATAYAEWAAERLDAPNPPTRRGFTLMHRFFGAVRDTIQQPFTTLRSPLARSGAAEAAAAARRPLDAARAWFARIEQGLAAARAVPSSAAASATPAGTIIRTDAAVTVAGALHARDKHDRRTLSLFGLDPDPAPVPLVDAPPTPLFVEPASRPATAALDSGHASVEDAHHASQPASFPSQDTRDAADQPADRLQHAADHRAEGHAPGQPAGSHRLDAPAAGVEGPGSESAQPGPDAAAADGLAARRPGDQQPDVTPATAAQASSAPTAAMSGGADGSAARDRDAAVLTPLISVPGLDTFPEAHHAAVRAAVAGLPPEARRLLIVTQTPIGWLADDVIATLPDDERARLSAAPVQALDGARIIVTDVTALTPDALAAALIPIAAPHLPTDLFDQAAARAARQGEAIAHAIEAALTGALSPLTALSADTLAAAAAAAATITATHRSASDAAAGRDAPADAALSPATQFLHIRQHLAQPDDALLAAASKVFPDLAPAHVILSLHAHAAAQNFRSLGWLPARDALLAAHALQSPPFAAAIFAAAADAADFAANTAADRALLDDARTALRAARAALTTREVPATVPAVIHATAEAGHDAILTLQEHLFGARVAPEDLDSARTAARALLALAAETAAYPTRAAASPVGDQPQASTAATDGAADPAASDSAAPSRAAPPAALRLDDLRAGLRRDFPRLVVDFEGAGHAATTRQYRILRFSLPEALRNQGHGTRAMARIIDFADANGFLLTVPNLLGDANGNMPAGQRFLRRFGFEINLGETQRPDLVGKDYVTDAFYRDPDPSRRRILPPGLDAATLTPGGKETLSLLSLLGVTGDDVRDMPSGERMHRIVTALSAIDRITVLTTPARSDAPPATVSAAIPAGYALSLVRSGQYVLRHHTPGTDESRAVTRTVRHLGPDRDAALLRARVYLVGLNRSIPPTLHVLPDESAAPDRNPITPSQSTPSHSGDTESSADHAGVSSSAQGVDEASASPPAGGKTTDPDPDVAIRTVASPATALTADRSTWEGAIWAAANDRWNAGHSVVYGTSLRTTVIAPKNRDALRFHDGRIQAYEGRRQGREHWIDLGPYGQSIDSLAHGLGLPTSFDRSAARAAAMPQADTRDDTQDRLTPTQIEFGIATTLDRVDLEGPALIASLTRDDIARILRDEDPAYVSDVEAYLRATHPDLFGTQSLEQTTTSEPMSSWLIRAMALDVDTGALFDALGEHDIPAGAFVYHSPAAPVPASLAVATPNVQSAGNFAWSSTPIPNATLHTLGLLPAAVDTAAAVMRVHYDAEHGSERGYVLQMPTGDSRLRGATVARSSRHPGQWQVTWFDRNGFSGDTTRATPQEAFLEAFREGYRIPAPTLLRDLMQTSEFHAGNAATDEIARINAATHAGTRGTPFAPAAPAPGAPAPDLDLLRDAGFTDSEIASAREGRLNPRMIEQAAQGYVFWGDWTVTTPDVLANALRMYEDDLKPIAGRRERLAAVADRNGVLSAGEVSRIMGYGDTPGMTVAQIAADIDRQEQTARAAIARFERQHARAIASGLVPTPADPTASAATTQTEQDLQPTPVSPTERSEAPRATSAATATKPAAKQQTPTPATGAHDTLNAAPFLDPTTVALLRLASVADVDIQLMTPDERQQRIDAATAAADGVQVRDVHAPGDRFWYYLSKGEQAVRYTLRYHATTPGRDDDRHVRTFGEDFDDAVQKARIYLAAHTPAGQPIPALHTAEPDRRPIGARDEMDAPAATDDRSRSATLLRDLSSAPETAALRTARQSGPQSTTTATASAYDRNAPSTVATPLSAYGLKVKPLETRAGKPYWFVTGRIDEHQALLDRLGAASPFKLKNAWGRSFFDADPTDRILAAFAAANDPSKAPTDPLDAAGLILEKRTSRSTGKDFWTVRGDLTTNATLLDRLGAAAPSTFSGTATRAFFKGDPTEALRAALSGASLPAQDDTANRPSIDTPRAQRLIASNRLHVDADPKGNGFVVTGKTYDHRSILNDIGGTWDGSIKGYRFAADPTGHLGAALADLDARGSVAALDGGDAGRGIDAEEARVLLELRERERGRPDERQLDRPAAESVSDTTRALIERGLQFGIPAPVARDQIEDIALIHRAYERQNPLFILANAAGTGKTFVLGGAIRELREAGQERFVYLTLNTDLIEQIKRDLAPYGLDGVSFHTYAELSNAKSAPIDVHDTVVLADEAHNLKNVAASRGQKGQDLLRAARMTIAASATPFENPIEARYLAATGVFDSVGGFETWAKMYGAAQKSRTFINARTGREQTETIAYWPSNASKADGKAARDWFMARGIMTQRAMQIDPALVDVRFNRFAVSQEYVDLYNQVNAAYDDALDSYRDRDGNVVAAGRAADMLRHRENTLKRILEAAKLPGAIEQARTHLADGKRVALFTETKSDRELGRWRMLDAKPTERTYSADEVVAMMQEWRQEAAMARIYGDGDVPPPPFAEFIEDLAVAFDNRTIRFDLPSPADEIVAAFGKDAVAVYTGAVSAGQATKAKEAFRAGEKKLMVLTMAKGGTGLSLHDTDGDKPTVQLNLTLPWTATAVEQVSARCARYGLQSKAVVGWLFASNIPWEAEKLAPKVGRRMAEMGALVKGVDVRAADALTTDFDFEGTLDVRDLDPPAALQPAAVPTVFSTHQPIPYPPPPPRLPAPGETLTVDGWSWQSLLPGIVHGWPTDDSSLARRDALEAALAPHAARVLPQEAANGDILVTGAIYLRARTPDGQDAFTAADGLTIPMRDAEGHVKHIPLVAMTADDPVDILYHEAGHVHLREGRFDDHELAVFTDPAHDALFNDLAARYDLDRYPPSNSPGRLLEELACHLAGDWASSRAAAEPDRDGDQRSGDAPALRPRLGTVVRLPEDLIQVLNSLIDGTIGSRAASAETRAASLLDMGLSGLNDPRLFTPSDRLTAGGLAPTSSLYAPLTPPAARRPSRDTKTLDLFAWAAPTPQPTPSQTTSAPSSVDGTADRVAVPSATHSAEEAPATTPAAVGQAPAQADTPATPQLAAEPAPPEPVTPTDLRWLASALTRPDVTADPSLNAGHLYLSVYRPVGFGLPVRGLPFDTAALLPTTDAARVLLTEAPLPVSTLSRLELAPVSPAARLAALRAAYASEFATAATPAATHDRFELTPRDPDGYGGGAMVAPATADTSPVDARFILVEFDGYGIKTQSNHATQDEALLAAIARGYVTPTPGHYAEMAALGSFDHAPTPDDTPATNETEVAQPTSVSPAEQSEAPRAIGAATATTAAAVTHAPTPRFTDATYAAARRDVTAMRWLALKVEAAVLATGARGRAALVVSNATPKDLLDRQIMAAYGVDAADARTASNRAFEVEDQHLDPADRTVWRSQPSPTLADYPILTDALRTALADVGYAVNTDLSVTPIAAPQQDAAATPPGTDRDFAFTTWIRTAAADVASLRRIDVDRVMGYAHDAGALDAFAVWLRTARPDLAQEIADVQADRTTTAETIPSPAGAAAPDRTPDFLASFPPPVRTPDRQPPYLGDPADTAEQAALHDAIALDLSARLTALDGLADAATAGIDPRTGRRPRGPDEAADTARYVNAARAGETVAIRDTLAEYAAQFGHDAAARFEAHIRDAHARRQSEAAAQRAQADMPLFAASTTAPQTDRVDHLLADLAALEDTQPDFFANGTLSMSRAQETRIGYPEGAPADIDLDAIEAATPGNGWGTTAIRLVTALADRHGASLFVQAHAMLPDDHGDEDELVGYDESSQSRLIGWYERQGFTIVHDGGDTTDMRRSAASPTHEQAAWLDAALRGVPLQGTYPASAIRANLNDDGIHVAPRGSVLTPSPLDTETQDDLMNGGCFPLALAIHDATGLSLVGVRAYSNPMSSLIDHVAVALPDGTYLDARGILTREGLLDTMVGEAFVIEDIARDDVERLSNENSRSFVASASIAAATLLPLVDHVQPAHPTPATPAERSAAPRATGAAPAPAFAAGAEVPAQPATPTAFTITSQSDLAPTGQRAKVDANLTALRLLNTLTAEARPATADEQRTLARYSGWGHSPQIFDDAKAGDWAALRADLRSLLSDDAYAAARLTTINAHYTSHEVIASVWQATEDLGFPGGRVLEPGCGIGNFMGALPAGLAANTRMVGVELDPTTAAIARHLYPMVEIRAESFETTNLPPASMDLVIGNVPFGKIALHDPRHNKAGHSIHNHFIIKSLAFAKPGAVMALVTSRYTLDARNPSARRDIALGADLLGAVRLPETAFRANAGTDAVTDILFLRKRHAHEQPLDQSWIGTTTLDLPAQTDGADPVHINRYFVDHPSHVLGTFAVESGMYNANTLTVKPNPGPLAAQIAAAVSDIVEHARTSDRLWAAPAHATPTTAATAGDLEPSTAPADIKEGAFYLDDAGTIRIRRHGYGEPANVPAKEQAEVALLIQLRDTVHDILDLQSRDTTPLPSQSPSATSGAEGAAPAAEAADQDTMSQAPLWAPAQARLNALYDDYKSTYGAINRFSAINRGKDEDGEDVIARRYPKFGGFRRDPDFASVIALENFDDETQQASKAPIFSKRVLNAPREIRGADDAHGALLAVLEQTGRVDLSRMAALLGTDEPSVIAELKGAIYKDPTLDAAGQPAWVTADAYLSGNVRVKLRAAEAAAQDDPATYADNVAALQRVQPRDLHPRDIKARLGAPWIPAGDIQAFANAILGTDSVSVAYAPIINAWSVHAFRDVQRSVASRTEWGTRRRDALTLLEDALTGRPTEVYDVDSDGKRQKNAKATLAACEKREKIEETFGRWIWQDPDRATRLAAYYNEHFNNTVLRSFDGSHLTLPGLSTAINPRPHQRNVAWRVVQDGNTLMAHTVGAGKTFASIIAAMEEKRLGLTTKPAFAVPNHMLEQFAREYKQAYPAARLLIADKESVSPEYRKEFVARCALGDWDAVIFTHSTFSKIPVSVEATADFIREQVDDLEASIVAAKSGNDERGSLTVKRLETAKKNLTERLKGLINEDVKDDGITFEKTGIDRLFVDECFPYETPILTDRGWLPIGFVVESRLKANVLSMDRATGSLEWKPIIRWLPRERKTPMVKVIHERGEFICTDKHKIATGAGYVAAQDLDPGTPLYSLPEDIRPERGNTAAFLLEGLSGSSKFCSAGPSGAGLPPLRQDLPREAALGSAALLFTGMQVRLAEGAAAQDGRQDLRNLRNRVPVRLFGRGEQRETAVLFESMRGHLPQSSPRSRGAFRGDHRANARQILEGTEASGRIGAYEGEQSEQGPGDSRQDFGGHERQNLFGSWRERSTDRATEVVGRRAGPANGTRHTDGAGQGPVRIAATLLQGGHSGSISDAGYRGGWLDTPSSPVALFGQAQDRSVECSRVVRVEVYEPGSDGGRQPLCGDCSTVYDLEVADHHNYFAAGVLVSNCHLYKNLSFQTSRAGVSAPASQRAEDLFLKKEILEKRNPGRSLVGMTGTPIANRVAEMFVMQKYFDKPGLVARGIAHFDAWAANFGQDVTSIELAPDGASFRMNTRFAKYVNVPELLTHFRQFTDVQTADMLALPVPALLGGKPRVVSVPASPMQKAYIESIKERIEAIKAGDVLPTEDNMLKVTSDGRKAAADMRLLGFPADPEGGKAGAIGREVARIYHDTKDREFPIWGGARMSPNKGAMQAVFCDLGTPKADGSFNMYDAIRDAAVANGVPADRIKYIHDYSTDEAKARLFKDCRAGRVSVLIGSTDKMGVGTNIQDRLYAVLHADCPWRPVDIEQRDGRLVRQSNLHYDLKIPVEILIFGTEGTFDVYMWQTAQRKQEFISQVMTGNLEQREMEEIDSQALSYAEAKAILTGNPILMEKAGIDAEVAKLQRAYRNHEDDETTLRRTVTQARSTIADAEARIPRYEAALAALRLPPETAAVTERVPAVLPGFDATAVPIPRRRATDEELALAPDTKMIEAAENHIWAIREAAGKALLRAMSKEWMDGRTTARGFHRATVGQYAGLDIVVETGGPHGNDTVAVGLAVPDTDIRLRAFSTDMTKLGKQPSGSGFLQDLSSTVRGIAFDIAHDRRSIENAHQDIAQAEAAMGKPFEHAARLEALLIRQAEIDAQLADTMPVTGLDADGNTADGTAGDDVQPDQDQVASLEPAYDERADLDNVEKRSYQAGFGKAANFVRHAADGAVTYFDASSFARELGRAADPTNGPANRARALGLAHAVADLGIDRLKAAIDELARKGYGSRDDFRGKAEAREYLIAAAAVNGWGRSMEPHEALTEAGWPTWQSALTAEIAAQRFAAEPAADIHDRDLYAVIREDGFAAEVIAAANRLPAAHRHDRSPADIHAAVLAFATRAVDDLARQYQESVAQKAAWQMQSYFGMPSAIQRALYDALPTDAMRADYDTRHAAHGRDMANKRRDYRYGGASAYAAPPPVAAAGEGVLDTLRALIAPSAQETPIPTAPTAPRSERSEDHPAAPAAPQAITPAATSAPVTFAADLQSTILANPQALASIHAALSAGTDPTLLLVRLARDTAYDLAQTPALADPQYAADLQAFVATLFKPATAAEHLHPLLAAIQAAKEQLAMPTTADPANPPPSGTHILDGRRFATVTFTSTHAANAYMAENPQHGVLTVTDNGTIHVAHIEDMGQPVRTLPTPEAQPATPPARDLSLHCREDRAFDLHQRAQTAEALRNPLPIYQEAVIQFDDNEAALRVERLAGKHEDAARSGEALLVLDLLRHAAASQVLRVPAAREAALAAGLLPTIQQTAQTPPLPHSLPHRSGTLRPDDQSVDHDMADA